MKFLAALVVAAAPALVFAQDLIPTNPPYPVSAEQRSLKERILRIAYANQTRTDNTAAVRAQIDPLVHELVAITPPRTEPEKLYQVLGGWYQVWSDAPFLQPTPFGSYDLTKAYQVVFSGYYWNVSSYLPTDGPRVTQFLRGEFGVTLRALEPVKFTTDVFGIGEVPPKADVLTYAIRAESGEYDAQPTRAPSPVGLPQLPLINVYVDDNIRLVTSLLDGKPAGSLFVLLRSSALPDHGLRK
jgi:hypothetical protein